MDNKKHKKLAKDLRALVLRRGAVEIGEINRFFLDRGVTDSGTQEQIIRASEIVKLEGYGGLGTWYHL